MVVTAAAAATLIKALRSGRRVDTDVFIVRSFGIASENLWSSSFSTSSALPMEELIFRRALVGVRKKTVTLVDAAIVIKWSYQRLHASLFESGQKGMSLWSSSLSYY